MGLPMFDIGRYVAILNNFQKKWVGTIKNQHFVDYFRYLHCVISINNAYFQSRYLLYSLMSTKCKYWLTVGAGLLDEYLDTGLDGLPIDITWSRGCIPYMVVSSCMSL